MRFKRCVYCHTVLTREKRIGNFCSLKCFKKYNKKIKGKKWLNKDIQELIESMKITPNWYKLMEKDVKARKKAEERGDQRRRGIY